MRLVLITHGSTGDTIPMVRLAGEAVRRGHDAILLAAPYWRTAAEDQGVRFAAIPPHGGLEDQTTYMRRYSAIRNKVKLLEEMFRQLNRWLPEILPTLREHLEGSDALLCSYLFPLYHHVADERGIPAVLVHFCPNTAFCPNRAPEQIPELPAFLPERLREGWARSLTGLADGYLTRRLNACLSRPELRLRSWLRPPVRLNLILAPESVAAVRSDELPKGTALTGFVAGGFAGGKDGGGGAWDEGPLLGFGSVSAPGMAEEFRHLYRHWPKDRPLTIQAGWLPPPPPPAESRIRIIGEAPHSEIFPRATVLIHHGGAGTTTSALLAGKPQVVVPHFADQDFWGRTVRRLGCGTVLPRKGWGKRLAAAVDHVDRPPFRQSAREIQAREAAVDGAATAIKRLEHWIHP